MLGETGPAEKILTLGPFTGKVCQLPYWGSWLNASFFRKGQGSGEAGRRHQHSDLQDVHEMA